MCQNSQTHLVTCEVETESPQPVMYQPSKKWHPTLTRSLTGFEQSSSPLHQIYEFLLVKITEGHIILSN
jgi:hypothetical protein